MNERTIDLQGKTALITGSASGIGAATATRLASLGATVVGVDVADAVGEEVFAALGEPHRFRHLDVSDPDGWRELVTDIAVREGGLDLVFLNAGVMTRPPTEPLLDDPLDWFDPVRYRRVMAVNVDGVAFGLAAVVPHLTTRGGGEIVITSSGAGLRPFDPDPVYTASKYALIGLARSMSPSLRKRGININVICPHSVLTGIVPIDLRALPDKVFSPPDYIADSVVRILASGETGRVWVARQQTEPAWPVTFQDILARPDYLTSDAD